MQACTKPKTTSLTPTVGPLRASSKLRRKNSTKKGKNRQKRITPPTHVNEEAIRKVLEDIAAEKMAKMASEGNSPMLACRDDGSIKSSARSSGSETKLDSSTVIPSAQMKAKVKSATLGRTKPERSTASDEVSVDSLCAQEGVRTRSATVGKIKREKSTASSDFSTDVPSAQMKAKVKSATLGRTKPERSTASDEVSVDSLCAQEGVRTRSATVGKIKREKSTASSDFSTDVPSAQMKAKVKSATLGRTKPERSTASGEVSVDGLSAEEGMRKRSATLGKIKREKSMRNGESSMCSLHYSNSQESAMHAPSSCAMYTVLSCRMLYIRTVSVITYVECSHSQYHIHPQSVCSKCDPIVATYIAINC